MIVTLRDDLFILSSPIIYAMNLRSYSTCGPGARRVPVQDIRVLCDRNYCSEVCLQHHGHLR